MQARASPTMPLLLQPQHPHPLRQAALPLPSHATPARLPAPPRAPLAAVAAPRTRRLPLAPRPRASAAAGETSGGSDTTSASTTSTTSTDTAPNKTPWYSKNVEGWTTIESSADLARAAHAARRSNRRILALDLYAPWCAVCKGSWGALSRLARDPALSAEVLFCKASIDDGDLRRLLKEEGITGIPHVLVLDVGESGPEPPPSEAAETVGLLAQMFGQFVAKRFGGGGGKKQEGEASAAAAPAAAADNGESGSSRVLDAAGATLLLGQGAAFKRIAVLKSNLAAVPAMARRGQKVVVDPNGIVVVSD